MLAPALRVVAVVAELLVGLALAAQLRQVALVLLPELRLGVAAELLAHLAHKLLPLLLVAVVHPVALPQEAEVEVVVPRLLVQGLVASEILRSR
jgi:hypothetical protein